MCLPFNQKTLGWHGYLISLLQSRSRKEPHHSSGVRAGAVTRCGPAPASTTPTLMVNLKRFPKITLFILKIGVLYIVG
jgi:hypothetical protein